MFRESWKYVKLAGNGREGSTLGVHCTNSCIQKACSSPRTCNLRISRRVFAVSKRQFIFKWISNIFSFTKATARCRERNVWILCFYFDGQFDHIIEKSCLDEYFRYLYVLAEWSKDTTILQLTLLPSFGMVFSMSISWKYYEVCKISMWISKCFKFWGAICLSSFLVLIFLSIINELFENFLSSFFEKFAKNVV